MGCNLPTMHGKLLAKAWNFCPQRGTFTPRLCDNQAIRLLIRLFSLEGGIVIRELICCSMQLRCWMKRIGCSCGNLGFLAAALLKLLFGKSARRCRKRAVPLS